MNWLGYQDWEAGRAVRVIASRESSSREAQKSFGDFLWEKWRPMTGVPDSHH